PGSFRDKRLVDHNRRRGIGVDDRGGFLVLLLRRRLLVTATVTTAIQRSIVNGERDHYGAIRARAERPSRKDISLEILSEPVTEAGSVQASGRYHGRVAGTWIQHVAETGVRAVITADLREANRPQHGSKDHRDEMSHIVPLRRL